MSKPFNYFFWLSVLFCVLFEGASLYCASHGVACWPGIVMGIYWLILAWGHGHEQ